MSKILLCLICLAVCTFAAAAQNAGGVLRALLELPAAPAVAPANAGGRIYSAEDPFKPEFYSRLAPPADDAPIDQLRAYWARQAEQNKSRWSRMTASEKSARRLLELSRADWDELSSFVGVFPSKPEFVAAVEEIYEKAEAADETLGGEVDEWLKANSSQAVPALLEELQEIEDKEDYLDDIRLLLNLARLDWERAQGYIELLSAETERSPLSILALGMRHENAVFTENARDAEKFRRQLTDVLTDKSAAVAARQLAFRFLTKNAWQGQDELLAALFEDETLFAPDAEDEDETLAALLFQHVRENPDKFVPIAARYINHQNSSAHNAAVYALLQFDEDNPRTDAQALVVPLLSNPRWIKDEDGERREELIKTFFYQDEIFVPESVPGLIWTVENDPDRRFRAYAAEALAKYGDSRAVPGLWKALKKENETVYLDYIINGLIGSGGLTPEERLAALESYLAAVSTPEKAKIILEREDEYSAPLPVAISIGRYLCEEGDHDERFAALLAARIAELEKSAPETAEKFLGFIPRWDAAWKSRFLLERLAGGKMNQEAVIALLTERLELREKFAGEIFSSLGANGAARGFGAVLMEDENAARQVLSSADAEAKTALLAGARLIRFGLPVEEIGALLKNGDRLLALAAERYLVSEDSPAAQRLVLAHFKGEMFITGSREVFSPTGGSFADYPYKTEGAALEKLFRSVHPSFDGNPLPSSAVFKKPENLLREEYRQPNAPLETYAFLHESGDLIRALKIYPQKMTFSYQNNLSRLYERDLSEKEADTFRRVIGQIKIENLSATVRTSIAYQTFQYELLALNQDGGRRVYHHGYGLDDSFRELTTLFDSFKESGNFRLRYSLPDKIKELNILLADENLTAEAVWKKGDDLRVLVSRKPAELPGIADESIEERWKREQAHKLAAYSWRGFEYLKPTGKIVAQPAEVPFLRDAGEAPELYFFGGDTPHRRAWQVRAGNDEIRAMWWSDNKGLYRVGRAGGITPLVKGEYCSPLVSPDGKWLIAAKRDESVTYVPQYAVRINLRTGQEEKIALNPGREINPVAFVPAQNRFLIRRLYTFNSQPKYFWLNAETGALEAVQGDVRPLEQQTYRPLQPAAGLANVFWAAIPDQDANGTEVGLFDAKNLSFEASLKLPGIRFDSMNMWVDETDRTLCFIFQGHLLALPLPPKNSFPDPRR